MAFRFSLQPLLRLRLGVERQEELRLLRITSQINQLRQRQEELREENGVARQRLSEQLRSGIMGVQLHFESAAIAKREQAHEALEQMLLELEQLRATQQAAYRVAQKGRKILDNLRTRRLQAYWLMLVRREQQRIDELYLLRRRRVSDVRG